MSGLDDLKRADFFNGTAAKFIKAQILKSDADFAEGTYDAFGGDLQTTVDAFTAMLFLYKFYFRVDVHGMENLPAEGKGLIVSNHAGIIPFDAFMIGVSAVVEPEKPRFIRAIVNKFIPTIPYFSTLIARMGQIVGCDENVRRVFESERLLLVFPTGNEARSNTIFKPYRLHEFAQGFMEYALRFRTPIIPACVTGSEESISALAEAKLNMPGFKHFPITPTFPWLGPLGLVPFPAKFDIHYGEPVDYHTEHAEEADNPQKVRELVGDLRGKIQGMLDDALGRERTALEK